MTAAADLLRRLRAAWAPFGIERKCAKGAGAAALARVKRLGTVPADLLTLLRWHDGSRERAVDGYYALLSCREIVRHKKLMDDLAHGFEDAWMPGQWWSRDWIPFLEFNGDLVCLDGKGAVVSYDAHDDARPVLHRSFHHWLVTIVALWEAMPAGSDEDAQDEFFAGRAADRIRRKLNPGHPIKRRARRKPEPKAPRGIDYAGVKLQRGTDRWEIERAGATVRTDYLRRLVLRRHVKTFPSPDKARGFMEAQMRHKLRDGYQRVSESSDGRDKEFLAQAARHLKTLRG